MPFTTLTVTPTVTLLLALAAFVAGVVDAIAGGGGLITFPALIAAGVPPHLALGTNKGQSVFGSAASLTSFALAKKVSTRRALAAFPLGFIGSLLGARLVLYVPPSVLKPLVLVLLVAVAAFLAFRPSQQQPTATIAAKWHPLAAAVIGITVGCYDGFFGPGTGTFLIIATVALLGDTLTEASGNAKVVNFASNLAAVLMFAFNAKILWRIALPMAAAQFFGSVLGARLAVKGGEKVIRTMVLCVVTVLVCKLGWELWHG
jgi:uncharacterized membrane protein YfcA